MLKSTPILAIAFLLFVVSPVWGCPYCNSDVGREVAAGIFNGDFAKNAAMTLLSPLILLGFVVLLHVGIPRMSIVAVRKLHSRTSPWWTVPTPSKFGDKI